MSAWDEKMHFQHARTSSHVDVGAEGAVMVGPALPSHRASPGCRRRRLGPPLAGALLLCVLLGVGCGDEEPECQDLQHMPCELVGLSDDYQGYCDACQVLWTCLYGSVPEEEEPGYYLFSSDFPCSCIRDDGTVYPDYDSDSPLECQSIWE